MYRSKAIDKPAKNYIESDQLPIQEGRSSQKIDYLLRIGLAHNTSKLNMYRRVLSDPSSAVNNQITRPYVAEVLDSVLDLIFNDATLWNRVKTILLKSNNKRLTTLREDISEEGLRALVQKSMEHEVPLETIFEVYNRGAEIGSENDGFNRVNSFISGGKARKLDADLLGETVVQPAPAQDVTLSTVKRILKESRRT